MSVSAILLSLRGPLVALALCALAAQQLVGFAFAANPSLSDQGGFTLCLSAELTSVPGQDDQNAPLGVAHDCLCLLIVGAALAPAPDAGPAPVLATAQPPIISQTFERSPLQAAPPPPARAPPAFLA